MVSGTACRIFRAMKSALILMGVGLVFVGRARPQDAEPAPTKDHPQLEVDVRKFGYKSSSGAKPLRTFVDFTDVNHLALAWLTLDDPTVSKATGVLTPRSAHVHVLVLDARTGQKQGQREWPTPSTPVRFFGVRDGGFLTCTGNVLHSFSPDFEVLREKDLLDDRACLNPSWRGQGVSPSRQSLLLSFPSGQGYQNELVEVQTFAVVSKWAKNAKQATPSRTIG